MSSNIAMLVDISEYNEKTFYCSSYNFIVIVDYNNDYYLCKQWSLKYNYFLLSDADAYEKNAKVVYFDEVTSYKIIDAF